MGRPKVPIITRKAVAEAALAIIDRDGIDELNIRRLGDKLGVNGASLYHHYKDKDEILGDVGRLVLSEVKLPDPERRDWKEWLVEISVAYHAALLRHFNALPLMLADYPRTFRHRTYEYLTSKLNESGVPVEHRLAILQSLEAYAIGSALVLTSANWDLDVDGENASDDEALLLEAARAASVDVDEFYAAGLRSLLDGLLALPKSKTSARARQTPTKRSSPTVVAAAAVHRGVAQSKRIPKSESRVGAKKGAPKNATSIAGAKKSPASLNAAKGAQRREARRA